MKFGNQSQISFIAEEVGGAVGAAPPEAQIELFDALIDGCKEAVEVEILDPKVGLKTYSFVSVSVFVLNALHTFCLVCSCNLTNLYGNY